MFLANLHFYLPFSKCSKKWKERSCCWESAPSPKPLTPTPISRQPLGGFQQKLNPSLREDHPSSTRTVGTTTPPPQNGSGRGLMGRGFLYQQVQISAKLAWWLPRYGDRGWGHGEDNDNNKWIRSCGGIMFLSMYCTLHTVFCSDNKMTRMWKFT